MLDVQEFVEVIDNGQAITAPIVVSVAAVVLLYMLIVAIALLIEGTTYYVLDKVIENISNSDSNKFFLLTLTRTKKIYRLFRKIFLPK